MSPILMLGRQEVILFNRCSLYLIGALTLLPHIAFGADLAKPCVDLGMVRDAVTARDGKLTELTQGQWQFLRGIYAMNPETPPGLPYGDRAMLAQVDGRSDGLVLFVDGDQACTPMHAPPELLLLMHEVATGNISHYGAGL
jgi:hypothetical protein